VLKFGPIAVPRDKGEAELSAKLDLRTLAVETRLDVTSPSDKLKFWSGPPPSATIVVEDALEAPKRQLDVGSLSAGLATQAIARETDRIANLEADIRERAFFNRRLKGERFMDKRAAEIEDWRVEQARLKGLAEKLAGDREAEAKAAAEKAAAEKAAAEKAAAEKAAAERALAEPELPPELPPPDRSLAPSQVAPRGDELGANSPPVVAPLPPARPKPRPTPPPDPTASGLY
jgi:hypothetical protein